MTQEHRSVINKIQTEISSTRLAEKSVPAVKVVNPRTKEPLGAYVTLMVTRGRKAVGRYIGQAHILTSNRDYNGDDSGVALPPRDEWDLKQLERDSPLQELPHWIDNLGGPQAPLKRKKDIRAKIVGQPKIHIIATDEPMSRPPTWVGTRRLDYGDFLGNSSVTVPLDTKILFGPKSPTITYTTEGSGDVGLDKQYNHLICWQRILPNRNNEVRVGFEIRGLERCPLFENDDWFPTIDVVYEHEETDDDTIYAELGHQKRMLIGGLFEAIIDEDITVINAKSQACKGRERGIAPLRYHKRTADISQYSNDIKRVNHAGAIAGGHALMDAGGELELNQALRAVPLFAIAKNLMSVHNPPELPEPVKNQSAVAKVLTSPDFWSGLAAPWISTKSQKLGDKVDKIGTVSQVMGLLSDNLSGNSLENAAEENWNAEEILDKTNIRNAILKGDPASFNPNKHDKVVAATDHVSGFVQELSLSINQQRSVTFKGLWKSRVKSPLTGDDNIPNGCDTDPRTDAKIRNPLTAMLVQITVDPYADPGGGES